ncbi:hypothetical protein ACLB1R_18650 [Escherichia coli]
MGDIEREKIFKHVEDGMVSLDDELATVVATGLIEAIVTATDSNSLLWQDVSKFLGDKSKSHALVCKILVRSDIIQEVLSSLLRS